MFFGMTIYDVLWYFMIYAVVGWMVEVSYHAVTVGKVINRGFLNGPACPVYGCGVILVLSSLDIIGDAFGIDTDLETASALLLFVVGIIFATLVELIAGFLLDKLFHARWWDYRDRKFNLNGYICLEFSIIWGLGIAFVLRVIQPTFDNLIDIIPVFLGNILLIFMYAVFVIDLIITVMTILNLNKQLEHMQKMEASILRLSDGMSEVIATGTMKTMDKLEEGKKKGEARREEHRAEWAQKREALHERYAHMKKQLEYNKLFGTGMLLNNYLENGHNKYQDIIAKINSANPKNS